MIAVLTRNQADLFRLLLRLTEIVGVDENRKPAWAKLSAISGWLEFGCDPDLDIFPTVEAEVARRSARGAEPIGSPDYLTEAVKRAKVERLKAATEQPAERDRRQPSSDGPRMESVDAEGDSWRARLKGLRDRGLWLDHYGPVPGDKRCKVPAPILAEFGLGDPTALKAFLARHAEAA